MTQFEKQICVSCGKDFSSQGNDPIPICPDCEREGEERTTTDVVERSKPSVFKDSRAEEEEKEEEPLFTVKPSVEKPVVFDESFTLPFEPKEKSSDLLFGKSSWLSAEKKQKILIAISLAVAFGLIIFLMQYKGAPLLSKTYQWWKDRNRKADRVDEYIARFKQERGEVSGTADEFFTKGQNDWTLETRSARERAFANFQMALIVDRDHVGAMAGLAEIYAEKSDHPLDLENMAIAYDFGLKAVTLSPKDPLAARAFAHVLVRANNRHEEAKQKLELVLSLQSNDAQAHLLMGRLLLQIGVDGEAEIFNLARSHFEKALEMNPHLGGAYYYRGLIWMEEFEYKKAEEDFMRLQAENFSDTPYRARSLYQLGRLNLNLGLYERANSFFEKTLRQDPKELRAAVEWAGSLLHYLGKSEEVEQRTKGWTTAKLPAPYLEQEVRRLHVLLALSKRALGKRAEAMEILTRLKDDRMARFDLAVILLEQGEVEEAYRHFESLEDVLESWKEAPILFRYFYGDALARSDNAPKAMQAYLRLIEEFPDFPHGYVALAGLFYGEKRDKEAEELLMKACSSNLLYLREHQWRQQLDAAYAVPDIKRLFEFQQRNVQQNTYSMEARAGLGYLLALAGRNEEALEQVKYAYGQDPNDANLISLYATLLSQAQKYRMAIEIVRKVWRNDPQNPKFLLALGENYLALGDAGQAKKFLENILSNPKAGISPRVYVAMGKIAQQEGESVAARRYFTQALLADPTLLAPKRALYQIP